MVVDVTGDVRGGKGSGRDNQREESDVLGNGSHYTYVETDGGELAGLFK
jgi:hypothetical protein